MKKALSLSGSSLKGSALSIEVSTRTKRGGKPDSSSSKGGFSSSRGGFTSPQGGGYNRGELQCLIKLITF